MTLILCILKVFLLIVTNIIHIYVLMSHCIDGMSNKAYSIYRFERELLITYSAYCIHIRANKNPYEI